MKPEAEIDNLIFLKLFCCFAKNMPKTTVGDIDINHQIQGSSSPLLLVMKLSFSLFDWGTELPALLAPNHHSSSSTTAMQA
jgi:hypothetical protein